MGNVLYPAKPFELPTFFAAQAVVAVIGDLVYLDFCQQQPQQTVDGKPVAAVVCRVVIPVSMGLQMPATLIQALTPRSPVPQPETPPIESAPVVANATGG